MRVKDVPQDPSILEGHQRACYARDAAGHYVIATSRGWEVERVANQHAVREIDAHVGAVLRDVKAGKLSALAYHMACSHMDTRLLAAHTGIWSFRIRRHLRPDVFRRLPESIRRRYAAVFNIDAAALASVPD
ncbi:MAG: hypothetical protein ACKVQU_27785 [Burkholderiales bacterium]